MTRKETANDMLKLIEDFLEKAGWTVCQHTLFHIDPITECKYPSDTALSIQLGRDLSK